LMAALSGGVIVLVYKAIQGELGMLLKNIGNMIVYRVLWLFGGYFPNSKIVQQRDRFQVVPSKEKGNYIPYSVAIGLGALSVLALQAWGRIPVI
ncbi:MAG: hypothetical protein HGA54_01850, partial [Actinobacteria bacterium]|nr:hypothetical protein [Actinomycetota bacterium]